MPFSFHAYPALLTCYLLLVVSGSCSQPEKCTVEQLVQDSGEEPGLELLQRNARMFLFDSNKTDGRTHAKGHYAFREKKREFEVQPVTTTLINISKLEAAEASGVTMNGEGDLASFICSVIGYFIGFWVMIYSFAYLRSAYPLMYMRNILIDKCAPKELPDSKWGWWETSLSVTEEETADAIGLDNALLLEFSNMSMSLMTHLGVPLVCVLGLLHLFCGGYAAGKDHMSYLSMGNVETGSWLYWVHCLVVWFVVVTVKETIFSYQKEFLLRRYRWLRRLPEPRCKTVLVESIPEVLQSDEKLKDFFVRMFSSDKVKSAYVAKKTHVLTYDVARKEADELLLKQAEAQWEADGKDPEKRPMRYGKDVIETLQEQIRQSIQNINEERESIKASSSTPGGVNGCNGFVTFNKRCDAEVALSMQYLPDADEMAVSVPPAPSSIIWSSLYADPRAAGGYTALGYALVGGLYIAYLPLVVGITNIAKGINMGPLQPAWAGFAPTMGLQFMVAFLPTFLLLIFRLCFPLKDDAYAQHKLQNWYFAFNVVFVILVTSIGTNVIEFMKTAATNPFGLITLFANTMPLATHYYMNFMVLQPVTHAMNLTRYFPLMKFWGFKKLYNDETEAANASEPEDQDYYGIGSRMARHVTLLLIGIIFCTLCPPMTVLTWFNFKASRLVYGYLVNFAETKKPDLGGHFWVSAMKHMFLGLLLYILLMSGVLYGRAASGIPSGIAFVSVFYLWWAYNRFMLAFSWEQLPFEELVANKNEERNSGEEYVQPELKSVR